MDLPDRVLEVENTLSEKIHALLPNFTEAYIVYNPLEYAREPHAAYVRRFCNSSKKILFLGENPSAKGMCQTGVPFGDKDKVRDWLRISGEVGRPNEEHPKNRIQGFDYHLNEQSGKRFYGFFQELCNGNVDDFFRHAFVYNYCPITLLNRNDDEGQYVGLTKLKVRDTKDLFSVCDDALIEIVKLVKIDVIIAAGRFTETRANAALNQARGKGDHLVDAVTVLYMPHPSRQNRRYAKNEIWYKSVRKLLENKGLMGYFTQNAD